MPPTNQNNQIQPNDVNDNLNDKHWSKPLITLGILFLCFIILAILLYIFPSIMNKKEDQINDKIVNNFEKCSNYFGICLNDPSGKWKIISNGLNDFDLINEEYGITLFIMNSNSMRFKESGTSYTEVSLLGQNKPTYKDTNNGLTRIITGMNGDKGSILILLASEKDISLERTKEIMANIKYGELKIQSK
ncbi:MAG: hypothetical protein WCP15_01510 [bacterium]